MLWFSIVRFVYLLLYIQRYAYCKTKTKYAKNEDKLVLKPIDLIDLILEERSQIPTALEHRKATDKLTEKQLCVEEATEAVSMDDASHLHERKVWSRWGKWSECSGTCGEGARTRERACVAGRCARGEREEQRRPCARAPCDTLATSQLYLDSVYNT